MKTSRNLHSEISLWSLKCISHIPYASPWENGIYHGNLRVLGWTGASGRGYFKETKRTVANWPMLPVKGNLRSGSLLPSQQYIVLKFGLNCGSYKPKNLNRIIEKPKWKSQKIRIAPPPPVTCLWILYPKSNIFHFSFSPGKQEGNGKGNNSCKWLQKTTTQKQQNLPLAAFHCNLYSD